MTVAELKYGATYGVDGKLWTLKCALLGRLDEARPPISDRTALVLSDAEPGQSHREKWVYAEHLAREGALDNAAGDLTV